MYKTWRTHNHKDIIWPHKQPSLSVFLLSSFSLLLIWSLGFLVQFLPHLPHGLSNLPNFVVGVRRLHLRSFFTHEDEIGGEGALGSVWVLLAHRGTYYENLLRSVIKLESL